MRLSTTILSRGALFVYTLAILHDPCNSLKATTKKNIGPNYQLFAKDTLEIGNELKNPDKFVDELNNLAQNKSPNTITGMIKGYGLYIHNFVNAKVVIGEGVFANKRNKLFVPIEYHGIKNPELEKLKPKWLYKKIEF